MGGGQKPGSTKTLQPSGNIKGPEQQRSLLISLFKRSTEPINRVGPDEYDPPTSPKSDPTPATPKIEAGRKSS
jgi:hypothetical protein